MHFCLHTKTFSLTAVLALTAVFLNADAAEIWSGSSVTFTKAAFADPALEANQDRLTANVWLTRATVQGLYNAAAESGYNVGSPSGTLWAFAGINNPEVISAAGYASLTFAPFEGALYNQIGNQILNRKGVVHLIEDDIYLEVTFTSWGVRSSGGGQFSYTRSTPSAIPNVPEPSAAGVFLGLVGLAMVFRRDSGKNPQASDRA